MTEKNVFTKKQFEQVKEMTGMRKNEIEELLDVQIIIREPIRGYGVVGQKKYTIADGTLYRTR